MMRYYQRLSDTTAILEHETPERKVMHRMTGMEKIDAVTRRICRSFALSIIASGKRETARQTVFPIIRPVTMMSSLQASPGGPSVFKP